MKNNWKLLSAICLCLLLFSACKKSPDNNTNNSSAPTNAQQQNQDVSNAKSESDNSDADVNSAMSNVSAFGKNQSVQALSICGATIDSSHIDSTPRYIVIKYDSSTPCGGRIRSGQVKVALINGNHWTDQHAELQITYSNFKVSYPLTNHFISFTGVKYMTNLSGFNWLSFLTGLATFQFSDNVSNMNVTFDDGATATWNISRVATYKYTYPTLYASFSGDSITPSGDTLDSWGITRWGNTFTVQEVQPWQANSGCFWAPGSGEYTCAVLGTSGFNITVTLGTDANGNPSTATCPSDFKIQWALTSNGANGTAILPYWW